MTEIIKGIEEEVSEKNKAQFQVGDRIIWKSIDRRDGSQDKSFTWYGAKGTVIMLMNFDRAYIALDNFPDCNDRKNANRFCADFDELELIEE